MNNTNLKYALPAILLLISIIFLIVHKKSDSLDTEVDDFQKYTSTLYDDSFINPGQALSQLDSLLNNRKNNEEEQAHMYFLKGEINLLNRQYDDALLNSQKAYDYYINTDEKYTSGLCLITISSAHTHLEQYQQAQEVAFDALQIGKEQKNPRLLGKVYNRLFSIHIALNDYDTGLMYILKTDSLFAVMKDTASLSACKNNIGAIYLRMKDYNNAVKYFDQAVVLMDNTADLRPRASTYNNLGYTYMMAQDFQNAILYLQKSIAVNKIASTVNPAPYKGLGKIFSIMSQADSSNYYYQKALEIYSQELKYSDMINILNHLISNNFISENYPTAIEWQTQRDSIQQIHWSKEKEELLSFANVKYEVLKKEDQVKQEEQKNKSNRIIFSMIALALLALIFALVVMFFNLRLRSYKQTTELEQKLLRIQMNPHFIFNTLAAIQNITLEGDPIKSTKLIAKFSRLMRQTFEYVRRENITLDQEISMIRNYIETQQARFNSQFSYTLDVDQDINVEHIKIPPMLLQPFIENSIEYGLKHLMAPGQLKVSIHKTGTALQFTIEDNGIGRDKMKKYDHTENEIHATDVFLSRLKRRHFGEEHSFEVVDLYDLDKKAAGTLVKFKLRIND